jgi:hypothetical protein
MSKSQQRFMSAAEDRGELPKGTAKRWAKHTPNIDKLPEKKHKSKHEKKAEFIASFISNFYDKLGMSKNAAANSPLLYVLTHAAELSLEKAAAEEEGPGAQVDEAANAIINSQDIALGVGAPFVLGGLAGAGLSRLFSPTQYEIKNLQKQELVAQYDSAIKELARRIQTRQQ